jgi:hypothetical protein
LCFEIPVFKNHGSNNRNARLSDVNRAFLFIKILLINNWNF